MSERTIDAIVRFEMAMLDADLTIAAAADLPLLDRYREERPYDWQTDPDCWWLQ